MVEVITLPALRFNVSRHSFDRDPWGIHNRPRGEKSPGELYSEESVSHKTIENPPIYSHPGVVAFVYKSIQVSFFN
jgi:hypothetical protein